jgi:hypothetical protein
MRAIFGNLPALRELERRQNQLSQKYERKETAPPGPAGEVTPLERTGENANPDSQSSAALLGGKAAGSCLSQLTYGATPVFAFP